MYDFLMLKLRGSLHDNCGPLHWMLIARWPTVGYKVRSHCSRNLKKTHVPIEAVELCLLSLDPSHLPNDAALEREAKKLIYSRSLI